MRRTGGGGYAVGGIGAGQSRTVRAAVCLAISLVCATRVVSAQPAAVDIARLGVRVTSVAPNGAAEGALFALDRTGQPIAELSPDALQARLDGRPVQLSFNGPRPSIALAAAFWLDS